MLTKAEFLFWEAILGISFYSEWPSFDLGVFLLKLQNFLFLALFLSFSSIFDFFYRFLQTDFIFLQISANKQYFYCDFVFLQRFLFWLHHVLVVGIFNQSACISLVAVVNLLENAPSLQLLVWTLIFLSSFWIILEMVLIR